MDPRIVVRGARPEDDEQLVGLMVDFIAEANPLLMALTGRTIVSADDESVRRWMATEREAGALVLVALNAGQAVGTGTLRDLEPGVAEVKRMYVRPEARGHGVGGALLEELLAAARVRGAGVVRLDSAPFQRSAHGLYRARGFEEKRPLRAQRDTGGAQRCLELLRADTLR